MPAVFVHGVPETPAVWDALIVALGRADTVCLQLPGFGCPLLDDFAPEMDRYATWLADELDAVDGPIDLVSHDWGGLLALRVLSSGGPPVRSWVNDMGDLDPTFRWHDLALVFQTPGEGEIVIDAWISQTVDERAEGLVGVGVPHHAAGSMAGAMDATMGAAILALYRSAVDIGSAWGPALDAIDAPGLLIESHLDGFRTPGRVAQLAERVGAAVASLPDNGHWWMLEDPAGCARIIDEFWTGL